MRIRQNATERNRRKMRIWQVMRRRNCRETQASLNPKRGKSSRKVGLMGRYRRISAILSVALAVLLTAECARVEEQEEYAAEDTEDREEAIRLVYYTIGEPDAGLKQVEEALNTLLLQRYGFTVSYNKTGWNDYEAKLDSLFSTDGNFDIAFAWTENYLENALAGNWLDLTPYMEGICADTWAAVNGKFWKGATVNGRIYGIPTNKELAVLMYLLYDRELVEKYDIDVTRYLTMESLEPLLRTVSRGEPDYIPLFLSNSHVNLASMGGYEYVTYTDIPLVIRTDDTSAEVVNLFETEYCEQLLDTLHKYYSAGYINEDASMRTAFSRFQGEKVFLRLAGGGPESDVSFSSTFGYPIVTQQVSDLVVTSESALGGIMAVNARTEHPEECAVFLNAVNTDPDVRNLLNYGVEGLHYRLNEDGQVTYLNDDYRGVAYTQGNWFILNTVAGENPDKWELYREFNDIAIESPILGFIPDLSGFSEECSNISQVCRKYENALMTGTVDPEEFLPRMRDELEQAGIGSLQQELQRQINIWMISRRK